MKICVGSWDMERDRQFFLILDHFLPFYHRNDPENQNFDKNEEHTWKYHYFTQVYQNHDHMLYFSWHIACNRSNCYLFILGCFWSFYLRNTRKIKILKKWKKRLEISIYICLPKIMIRWCTVPEIWCATDGRTDRKSDIERWVPHLKNKYLKTAVNVCVSLIK